MKRLFVTIKTNLLLKIFYKCTKTSQLFTKDTNIHQLQNLLKIPSYEGLGWLRLFKKLKFNEINSNIYKEVSFTVIKLLYDNIRRLIILVIRHPKFPKFASSFVIMWMNITELFDKYFFLTLFTEHFFLFANHKTFLWRIILNISSEEKKKKVLSNFDQFCNFMISL